jgi:hypothetical protein
MPQPELGEPRWQPDLEAQRLGPFPAGSEPQPDYNVI